MNQTKNKFEIHPADIKRMPRLAMLALELLKLGRDDRETIVYKIQSLLLVAIEWELVRRYHLPGDKTYVEEIYANPVNKAWIDKKVEDDMKAAEDANRR